MKSAKGNNAYCTLSPLELCKRLQRLREFFRRRSHFACCCTGISFLCCTGISLLCRGRMNPRGARFISGNLRPPIRPTKTATEIHSHLRFGLINCAAGKRGQRLSPGKRIGYVGLAEASSSSTTATKTATVAEKSRDQPFPIGL